MKERIKMLYRTLTPDFQYKDNRGSLAQLVSQGYSQVNILISNSGITRGGHFHKLCHEAFYVISGEVTVFLKKDGIFETVSFAAGDFFEIDPFTVHEMSFPCDCVMAVLYDRPVETTDGKDIYECEMR